MDLKTCTQCGIEKSAAEFNKRSRSNDGLQPLCKTCSQKAGSAYHAENRDELIKKQRISYLRRRDPGTTPRSVIRAQLAERLSSQRKLCTGCDVTKAFSDFNVHSRSADGLQCYCKECESKKNAVYRAAHPKKRTPRKRRKDARYASRAEGVAAWIKRNPEKRRATVHRYRAKNLVAVRARQAKWDAENKDYVRLKGRQWNLANAGRKKAASRNYRQRNKARINATTKRRRTSLTGAAVKWADQVKIIALYAEAQYRQISTGVDHAVDHIVPLKHPLVCGLHCEDNLQVLTGLENLKKGNKFSP